ncbi:MAG: trypsin-like serine protease, partial [Bdellovibrionaceae bacterium]|nr:trypsin-like serine protease [Pseudobdellovibrionaceae bacterium]
MKKSSSYFLISLLSLNLLLISCGKSFKGKTGTTTPPTKNIAYKFDSQNMCWSQSSIVGGSLMSENDPLSKSMVIILSTFEDIKTNTKHAYHCSGTLIEKNHILSAAHCFQKVGEKLLAASFVTANNMNCGSSFNKNLVFPINLDQIFYPKEFTAFEQPSSNSANNDIAIVSFEAILPTDYVPLPLSSMDLKKINSNQVKNLLLVGYGSTGT